MIRTAHCDCHAPTRRFANHVHAWYCPVSAARREEHYAEKLRMKRKHTVSPATLMEAFASGEELEFPSYHEDGRIVTGTIVSLTRHATGLGDEGNGVMYVATYTAACGATRTAYVLADADVVRV